MVYRSFSIASKVERDWLPRSSSTSLYTRSPSSSLLPYLSFNSLARISPTAHYTARQRANLRFEKLIARLPTCPCRVYVCPYHHLSRVRFSTCPRVHAGRSVGRYVGVLLDARTFSMILESECEAPCVVNVRKRGETSFILRLER